jgi:hypothetical protein
MTTESSLLEIASKKASERGFAAVTGAFSFTGRYIAERLLARVSLVVRQVLLPHPVFILLTVSAFAAAVKSNCALFGQVWLGRWPKSPGHETRVAATSYGFTITVISFDMTDPWLVPCGSYRQTRTWYSPGWFRSQAELSDTFS